MTSGIRVTPLRAELAGHFERFCERLTLYRAFGSDAVTTQVDSHDFSCHVVSKREKRKILKFILGFSLTVLACFAPVYSYAATNDEAVAFVEKAVSFAKENGKEAALMAFMDHKGQFVEGEFFLYAYDFKGTVLAHGGQSSLVGKNLIDMEDINGIMVIQELVKLARQGRGWLDYSWPDPLRDNTIQPKFGYVMKVDETWWLGSGLYPKE